MTKLGARKLHICPKVTRRESFIGYRFLSPRSLAVGNGWTDRLLGANLRGLHGSAGRALPSPHGPRALFRPIQQIDVSFSCVCPSGLDTLIKFLSYLIILSFIENEFRHNIVKKLWIHEAIAVMLYM